MNKRERYFLLTERAAATEQRAVAECSLRLLQADCLSEAVKHFSEGWGKLLVLDLPPDAASSLAMLKDARAAMPGLPIVVLVGPEENALAAGALREGAQGCLFKEPGTDGSALLRALRFGLERKQTELQRLRLADHIQLLLESTSGGLSGLDMEGRCTFINRAGAEMLGYRPEEMLGKSIHELVHHSRADGAPIPPQECRISRALADGQQLWSEDEIFWRKDGTPLVVGLSMRPVRENGVLSGAVVTYNDISARKRAEVERQALERRVRESQHLQSLGVLAGGVAHDFNNILTTAIGRVDMALREAEAGSQQARYLTEAQAALERAANLARQMLMYSGKGHFTFSPVDLNRLLTELQSAAPLSLPKEVTLRYRLAGNLPGILADAEQLRGLTVNLITNAAEALNAAGGAVTVSTGAVQADEAYLRECRFGHQLPAGQYVFLEVTDTGCGMDSAVLTRIFDPFYSTKFTGRGLGLPAVSGIVRGHRGAINVRSRVGCGTTFTVLFPAVPVGAATASAPAPAEQKSAPQAVQTPLPGTILVVDDEEGVRELARAFLEQDGFTVMTAADGREAVEIVQQSNGNLAAVVLDATMPRMTGVEALRHMRQVRPGLPALLMTGYSEDVLAANLANVEAVVFLQKPFRGAALCGKLRALLV